MSEEGGETRYISLLVGGPGLETVMFRIKMHTVLGKLMKVYCQRVGRDLAEVQFRFGGQLIDMYATALTMGMEDSDLNVVNVELKTGGPHSAPNSSNGKL